MIKLQHLKAQISDIHITNLYQVPNTAFEKYWNGNLEDYKIYQENYGLNYDWNVQNIDQLHSLATQSFIGFEKAINKSIGQFNFLLRSAVKPRNLPPLELDDYMKLEIDLSDEPEETKEAMKDNFFKMNTRSLIDFRELNGDQMIIIYNRRGIVNEEDRIAILKAKPSITLKENYKVAKDNNFIVSGILKDIAVPNTEFVYSYTTGTDNKEIRALSNDILDLADFRENSQKQEVQKQIEISTIAQNEIKKENIKNRQSLAPDSIYEELLKEGVIDIQIKESVDSTLSDYESKEIEKMKQRLARGREMADSVYKELRSKIDEGMGILEALNILKQKYREEHAVNMASVYLGKDLQELNSKEKTINLLEKTIIERDEALKFKDIEISKREDLLYNLRSNLTQKENEFRLFKEETETTIEDLETQTRFTIQEIKESHREEKKELEESLLVSDEIISKQDIEINTLKKQHVEQKALYESLQSKFENVSSENKQLFAENKENKVDLAHLNKDLLEEKEKSNKQEEVLAEIKEAREILVVQNKELYLQNNLLKKSIDELEEILKDLKSKNRDLESKIEVLNNDYKDLQNNLLKEIKGELIKNSQLSSEHKKIDLSQKSRVGDILDDKKSRNKQ